MTSGYILIAAILLLAGLIAALGDRLGSKVGKARLSLFSLRPRQTAVVVTVLTGTVIAASTLGILFAMSDSLRQGVFDLDKILEKRRIVQKELIKVTEEKKKVESELEQAKVAQAQARNRLDRINRNFQQVDRQLKAVSAQSDRLRADMKILLAERQQLFGLRNQLRQQVTQLREQLKYQNQALASKEQKLAAQDKILQDKETRLQELQQQQNVLQAQIARRDDQIAQLDQAIAKKDEDLQARSARLKDLESQLTFLKREVEILDDYYQTYQELRQKSIALIRGQVLAFGAIRIVDPAAATQAIDQLLRQANRSAIEAVGPGSGQGNERVVQITKVQVEQLLTQIQDGRDYVVRILSAGNYVQGERQVRVFADVAPNQEIFNQGETIATVSIDSPDISPEEMQKRLDLLLAAAQYRARRAGILGNIQVGDGNLRALLQFIEQLNQSNTPFEEIRAVASETAYTAGPLRLRLVAIKNGKVLFST